MKSIIFFTLTLVAYCSAQHQQYTTPIPILKQINRHNEDGSYSYGYEAGDGSFKIESKYPTGEVYGKYGYVDDSGKVREVEYGASRRGFEPQGSGIKVPPPTINNDNSYNTAPLGPGQEDDGQYREDPSVYYKDARYNRINNNNIQQQPQQPAYRPQQQPEYRPQQQPEYRQPQQPAYRPPQRQSFFDDVSSAPGPRQYYQNNQQPQQQYYNSPAPQQQQQQRQYYNPPQPIDNSIFRGHPAQNIDVNSGSYTVNYEG